MGKGGVYIYGYTCMCKRGCFEAINARIENGIQNKREDIVVSMDCYSAVGPVCQSVHVSLFLFLKRPRENFRELQTQHCLLFFILMARLIDCHINTNCFI
jgi:hypothetical protein